ncbi:MAG: SCP2 sterol-binding domain-containing protein [Actinomycetota bacterium]|nr:SCP2 sterol-binding domain-containing protein [Actinomycetota bacterium]
MATARTVEKKLNELIRRLDDAPEAAQANLTRALSSPRVVEVNVSDLDTRYWTELADGRFDELHAGPAPDAHIRVSATSDDLVDMIDGNKSLFSSYLAGHIKIQASLSDLLSLRKLL